MHGKVIVEAKRIGARLDGEVVRVIVQVNAIAIPRPDEGKVRRQSVGEDMAPTQGAAGVAIPQPDHLLHIELIVAMIERQEQAVVFAQ